MKTILKYVTIVLVSLFFIGGTTSVSNLAIGEYDPWCDLDDDGDIDIFDVVKVAGSYGASGEQFEVKAALEYDSNWMSISDKYGQSFNVTHNLNSTEIIVDIQGKTTLNGGIHQRNYGGADCQLIRGRIYSGMASEYAYSMVQTLDQGYFLAGHMSGSGSLGYDMWLVKTDSDGNMEWNRTYGGTGNEYVYSMVQTSDGGYAVSSCTESFGAGYYDFWLIKTDETGTMLWNQTYGGTGHEYVYSMTQTDDGGYALVGYTYSGGPSSYDMWLVKTDSDGNMEWNRTYGGTSGDEARSVIQTIDGGYAIAGYTASFGVGGSDGWLVKTDSSGNIEWNQTYGGTNDERVTSLIETDGGGYAILGYTYSFGTGSADFWLIKTDETGTMLWNQTYGGTDADYGWSGVQTSDGGYAVAGHTYSFGVGNYDSWLIKTDETGNVLWNRTYGGGHSDSTYSIVQTVDGGYILAGSSASFGTDGNDFWLLKVDSNGSLCAQWLKDWFRYGLAWLSSTANDITLYRGANDFYWNYVRVRIWKIKDVP